MYQYRENSTYIAVVRAAEEVLRERSKSQTEALSAKDLIKQIRLREKFEIGDASILSYLSQAANHDNQTKIDTGGPRGGYWFNENFKIEEVEVDVPEPSLNPREAHLYEIVRYWLGALKGVRSKDVSQLRSGKTWSNPDIVGINSTDRLGLFDVEIVSVEVKLSDREWRRYIFEAVSHKRFANRVFFLFRTNSVDFKLPDDMDRYAEQYRIGIATIYLSDDELSKIGSGVENENYVSYADRIVERVPAVYDFVPPRHQIEFLEQIGLKQREDVIRFGLDI